MGIRLLGVGAFGAVSVVAMLFGIVTSTSIVKAEEASKYQLGGTAILSRPGLNDSVYSVKTTADTSNRGGDISFGNLVGAKFSYLQTLSTDYQVTVGDCRGESPRFYVSLDSNNDRRTDVYIYYIISPNGSPCGNEEQNSGNVAKSTDKVIIHGLPWGTVTNYTAAMAQARYGSLVITGIGLVGDDINAQPNGQTILFDNVTINDDFFDFEPTDIAPPTADITSPDDGTTIYGNMTIRGSVDDNYKLQSYSLVIRNDEGEVVAGPGSVNVSGSIVDEELLNFDTTAIADGNYAIYLEASDAAGNKGPESIDVVNIAVNNVPDNKEQCKNDGYKLFPAGFKNQGLCAASVQNNKQSIASRALSIFNGLF